MLERAAALWLLPCFVSVMREPETQGGQNLNKENRFQYLCVDHGLTSEKRTKPTISKQVSLKPKSAETPTYKTQNHSKK